MDLNKKRIVKDSLNLLFAILFCWLYIPHFFAYLLSGKAKSLIRSDVRCMLSHLHIRIGLLLALLYLLHNNRYFRNIFYYRIGVVKAMLIGWYRPGDRYFTIPPSTKIAGGIFVAHPYSTVLNADYIGSNFTCLHCTTIGKSNGLRPIIGNNVTLGANVCIIGDVKVGNNVQIGAGSVVIKDIPDNSVAVGNPAKVIKTLPPN